MYHLSGAPPPGSARTSVWRVRLFRTRIADALDDDDADDDVDADNAEEEEVEEEAEGAVAVPLATEAEGAAKHPPCARAKDVVRPLRCEANPGADACRARDALNATADRVRVLTALARTSLRSANSASNTQPDSSRSAHMT